MQWNSLTRFDFARFWIETPLSIRTEVPAPEVVRRLQRQWSHDEGDMIVVIRPSWSRINGYGLIARRRGRRGGGMQRFFFSEVTPAGTGAVLAGAVRCRRPEQWLVAVALVLAVLLLLLTSLVTVTALVVDGARAAAEPGRIAGIIAVVIMFYAVMTQAAMAASVRHERYLVTWLTAYLS